jgi:hypothetical protein
MRQLILPLALPMTSSLTMFAAEIYNDAWITAAYD